MELSDLLFWNVDTQIDFVYPRGKLYVQGAEKLRPTGGNEKTFARSGPFAWLCYTISTNTISGGLNSRGIFIEVRSSPRLTIMVASGKS